MAEHATGNVQLNRTMRRTICGAGLAVLAGLLAACPGDIGGGGGTSTTLPTSSTTSALPATSTTTPTGLPKLSIGDTRGWEGDTKQSFLVFPITLSQPLTVVVHFHVTSVNGTADGADFTPFSIDSFIPAGATSTYVNVGYQGDTTVEPDETLTLVLSNPDNAVLGDATGLGTLLNDDGGLAVRRLAVSDVSAYEGDLGGGRLQVRVQLSQISNGPTSYSWSLVGVTANASDFTPVTGTGLLSTGQWEGWVDVPLHGDTTIEPNETFEFRVTNVTGDVTVADSVGVATILNDD